MGDERTYESTAVVRAVTSVDGMTADWARLPYELLARISARIINEVRGHQPRRLRHLEQAARHHRVGVSAPDRRNDRGRAPATVRALLSTLLLTAAACSHAPPPSTASQTERRDEWLVALRSDVDRIASADGFEGQVRVVHGGKAEIDQTFGLPGCLPLGAGRRLLAAIAVAALVQDGKLGLRRPSGPAAAVGLGHLVREAHAGQPPHRRSGARAHHRRLARRAARRGREAAAAGGGQPGGPGGRSPMAPRGAGGGPGLRRALRALRGASGDRSGRDGQHLSRPDVGVCRGGAGDDHARGSVPAHRRAAGRHRAPAHHPGCALGATAPARAGLGGRLRGLRPEQRSADGDRSRRQRCCDSLRALARAGGQ